MLFAGAWYRFQSGSSLEAFHTLPPTRTHMLCFHSRSRRKAPETPETLLTKNPQKLASSFESRSERFAVSKACAGAGPAASRSFFALWELVGDSGYRGTMAYLGL